MELPPEDAKEGYFAILKTWLYTMHGAAERGGRVHSEHGQRRIHPRHLAPTAFHHTSRDVRCLVQADDLTFARISDESTWMAGRGDLDTS